jgi:hypothetical protein
MSFRALLIAAATAILGAVCRGLRGRRRESHKRGVLLVGARRRGRLRRPGAGSLMLAGCAIPFRDETKHFKMIGTTGTGKSTAIRELLQGALARGDRIICADPDGGYRHRFFRRYRGDLVLNPFERESVQWDPFAEIREACDIDLLSEGLISSTDDPASNEWRAYARTFLTAILGRARLDPRRSAKELWRLLAIAPVEELRAVVVDTPAQPFIEPENLRMFGSIRSVAVSAMAAVQHLQSQRAAPLPALCSSRTRPCRLRPCVPWSLLG